MIIDRIEAIPYRIPYCKALRDGVGTMMGNQIDTQLGTAATLTFGAAFRSTSRRPAELSNYLDMSDDLIASPLTIADGVMRVSDAPGVGIDIDDDKLRHYRRGTA